METETVTRWGDGAKKVRGTVSGPWELEPPPVGPIGARGKGPLGPWGWPVSERTPGWV